MPEPAAIRATVDRYVEAFSAGDRDGWIDQFAPDATLEDPVGSDVRHGHEGIGEFWDMLVGMTEGAEMRRTGPVRVAAGEAAWPFQIRTKVGEDQMVLDVIDVMTFTDEAKIASMRAFWAFEDMRPEDAAG